MSLSYSISDGGYIAPVVLTVTITEEAVSIEEATERLHQLMDLIGESRVEVPVPEPVTVTAPTRSTHAPWTQQEVDSITCATSPAEAVRLYRGAFPDSKRTDYAIIKKYGKLPKIEPIPTPEPTETERILAHRHINRQIAIVEPEHDPTPIISCADHAPLGPTPRKNAWLPEEDDVVREAPSSEEAARLHGVVFPGKRTPAAIQARWYKFFPRTTHVCTALKAMAQDPPKIGDRVRYRGKPGTIKQIDSDYGALLILLDYNAGQVWTAPGTVEMMR